MTTDIITPAQVLARVPRVIKRIPKLMKAGAIFNPLHHHLSLGSVIEKAAQNYPNNPAIIYQDREISYRVFNQQANKVANFLISKGIRKGDVVALFMENRPEFLFCAVGIAKVGAVAALLNTSQTGKVLMHSINLVKPKMAIIGEELTGPFDEVRKDLDLPEDQVYFVADRDVLKDFGTPQLSFSYNRRFDFRRYRAFINLPTYSSVKFLFYFYYQFGVFHQLRARKRHDFSRLQQPFMTKI